MISTISTQAGRRYPQMRSTCAPAQSLASVGTTSTPVSTSTPGSIYKWGYRLTWAHGLLAAVLGRFGWF